MPNILLTQRCVRACPYCFAEKHMSESAPDDIMSWENLIYIADFLHVSGERRFPILGGEPTLHPDFVDMVEYLLVRDFDVNVFTSGVLSDEMLEDASRRFRDVPDGKLHFTCNLNDPDKTRTPFAEVQSVRRFLRRFGHRTTPGVNIYRTDFELEFLFRYINEYGLGRTIRMGIAHPIPGKKNLYIRPDQLDEVIARIFSYAPLMERLKIRPGFDCGFPLCRFSDEQLGWLYRFTGGKYDFGCGPVIDIGPDMTIWPCFPLSSFSRRSLFEFNHLKEIDELYRDLHRVIRIEAAGLYEACDACNFREQELCVGGCLAHALREFQHEARSLRLKGVYLP